MQIVSSFLLPSDRRAFTIGGMEQIARQVVFKGHVQGVGFRYNTLRIAGRYPLCGYVKNRPDGSVEALFQGTRPNIEACLDDIQDAMSGFIRDTVITEKPVNPRYTDFKITY